MEDPGAPPPPPDGGWGWVVVAGKFKSINHIIFKSNILLFTLQIRNYIVLRLSIMPKLKWPIETSKIIDLISQNFDCKRNFKKLSTNGYDELSL